MKHYYKTLEEYQAACKELDRREWAYRSEANPSKQEYWIEVAFIKGEVITRALTREARITTLPKGGYTTIVSYALLCLFSVL